MTKIKDIFDYLEEKYPSCNASSFDIGKIGMQFGNYNEEVKKVLITLDTTEEVIDEALANEVQLIISHHPFMFTPLIRLEYDSPMGRKLCKILSNKLNIIAMHTNFDVAENGMNDILAEKLGLKNIGFIGDEINSTTFLRFGYMDKISLNDLIELIKKVFNEKNVQVIGNPDKLVSKIGIVGGSGGSELQQAIKAQCDVFITGDVSHHVALSALEQDMPIIVVSHAIEENFKLPVKNELIKKFPEIEFLISKVNSNPFIKK